MSQFKHLERTYLATLNASMRELDVSGSSTERALGRGFDESAPGYGFLRSGQDVDAAEAACLAHDVAKLGDLFEKVEFMLRQMRQLTDETEEFDVYADQILSDLKAIR